MSPYDPLMMIGGKDSVRRAMMVKKGSSVCLKDSLLDPGEVRKCYRNHEKSFDACHASFYREM